MKTDGTSRTIREGMDVLEPWFWDTRQVPAREVEKLTPRQAHRYISAWAQAPNRPGTR